MVWILCPVPINFVAIMLYCELILFCGPLFMLYCELILFRVPLFMLNCELILFRGPLFMLYCEFILFRGPLFMLYCELILFRGALFILDFMSQLSHKFKFQILFVRWLYTASLNVYLQNCYLQENHEIVCQRKHTILVYVVRCFSNKVINSKNQGLYSKGVVYKGVVYKGVVYL